MIFLLITVYRTIILYVIVVLSIRLMGKRQIGDMQPGELVITMLISEIAAMPLQNNDQPLIFGISAIVTLVSLEIVISLLSLKSFLLRKLFSGKSVILIKDGIIDQQALKQVRMTVLDLVELLRGQNVFDISTVSFAVLETGGSLSVLLKSGKQTATAEDVNAKNPKAELPLPVISDGRILYESLSTLGVTVKLLQKHLKNEKIKPSQVFLMTMDGNGKATIIKRER